jgi:hypothetical protein
MVLLVRWIRRAVRREKKNQTKPNQSKKTQKKIQGFSPPAPTDPPTAPAANSLPHRPHQQQQRPSNSSQEDEEEEKEGHEEDRLEHDSKDKRHVYRGEGPLVSSHPEEVGDEVDEDFDVDSKEINYPESETDESRRSDE